VRRSRLMAGRVLMPIGSTILNVGLDPQQNIFAIVQHEPGKIDVSHPVIFIQMGTEYEPVIGRRIGKYLGFCMTPNLGPLGVFADDPWPKSILK
jgi:hypothetical protein